MKRKQRVNKVPTQIPKEPGKVDGEQGILNSEFIAFLSDVTGSGRHKTSG
jgi:hypothetical protein